HHTTHTRDAQIACCRLNTGRCSVAIGDHRPEFQGFKLGPILAPALLTVEHGPAVLELDRDGEDQPHRSRENQAGRSHETVEKALQHARIQVGLAHRPSTTVGRSPLKPNTIPTVGPSGVTATSVAATPLSD